MKNNVMLISLFSIFLFLAFMSVHVNNEFNADIPENDQDYLDGLTAESPTSTNAFTFISGLFYWVFGVPSWLNWFITILRVMFWVIVYDKIRGI